MWFSKREYSELLMFWNSIKIIVFAGLLKLYDPFLWMGFNCLKATEPLRGDSLLFTTKFPAIPGTHLIDLGRMKDWVDLEDTLRFWT